MSTTADDAVDRLGCTCPDQPTEDDQRRLEWDAMALVWIDRACPLHGEDAFGLMPVRPRDE